MQKGNDKSLSKGRKYWIFIPVFLLITLKSVASVPDKPIVFRSGKAEIIMEDHLHHPFYWWPNTLLSYPIVFDDRVQIEKLVLKDRHSGKQQPFQLTDIKRESSGNGYCCASFYE